MQKPMGRNCSKGKKVTEVKCPGKQRQGKKAMFVEWGLCMKTNLALDCNRVTGGSETVSA